MATFGPLDGAGSNVQTFSGDRMYLTKGTAASGGTVTNGRGRVRITATGSTTAKMVIYADSSGEPGALLAVSDQVTVNFTTSTETNFAFSGANQITISATDYWIGYMFDDPGTPSFEMRRNNTASVVRYKALTYPTAPDPFGTADGSSNGPLNAMIDYTEAGTNHTKTISDNFAFSETLVKSGSKTVSESMSFSESVKRDTSKLYSDTVNVSEIVSKSTSITKSDSLSWSESILSAIGRSINLEDTLTLSDLIAKGIAKYFSSTVTTSDIVSKATQRNVSSDSFSVTDTVSKSTTKVISSNLSITEMISRATSKFISSSIEWAENFSTERAFGKLLEDTFTVTDTLSKHTQKLIVSVLSITDTILKFLNGVLVKWFNLPKSSDTWSSAEKSQDSWDNSSKPTSAYTNTEKPVTVGSNQAKEVSEEWENNPREQ